MKNVVISGIIAALVSLAIGAGVLLTTPHQDQAAPKPGALAGPDIPSRYLNWGGVSEYKAKASLTTATTTPCALQSPSATSTLISAGIQLTVSSSTATIWDIARSATPYATTTAFGTAYNVGASKTAFINASTSPTSSAPEVFAPNTYLVFGARAGITAGDTAGTGFVPAGVCHATFEAYL